MLSGTAASDTLQGGNGKDLIFAGAGKDAVGGGNGSDAIFGGEGNDTVKGGNGKDFIHGGAGNDSLWGEAGADTIYGGDGNDTIMGGAGGDYIDGGTGRDCVAYMDSDAAVFIDLREMRGHGGYAQGDVYVNVEQARGSEFDDLIIANDSGCDIKGGAGADRLIGGAGVDELRGDGGHDLLTGNGGADQVMFDPTKGWSGVAADSDVMTDFNAAQGDYLDLHLAQVGFQHATATSPGSDIAEFVTLAVVGNDTIVSFDRDGAGAQYGAQELITLQGVTGLDVHQLYADHNIVI